MSFIFAHCTCVCRHLIVQQSVIYYLFLFEWRDLRKIYCTTFIALFRTLELGTTKIKLSECPSYYRILCGAHLFLDIYSHFPIKHQWDISQSLARILIECMQKRVLPVKIDRWSSADITTWRCSLLLYAASEGKNYIAEKFLGNIINWLCAFEKEHSRYVNDSKRSGWKCFIYFCSWNKGIAAQNHHLNLSSKVQCNENKILTAQSYEVKSKEEC